MNHVVAGGQCPPAQGETTVTYKYHPPPRHTLAVAAAAVTLTLHGGLLGLFHRQVPSHLLLSTPWIEEQLALCQARHAHGDRLTCQQTVARRARVQPDVMMVAQP